jgi:aerobic carbon-monoxide dehydrogenase medium subunit
VRPPPFAYHAPSTIDEACALKREHHADALVLAGGQSLIPLMTGRRLRPRALVDIKRIPELQRARRENGTLVLSAAVRQARLHDDPEIRDALPILAEAASFIGHVETRHRGTVGGSLAHGDPVAELPTLAVALGAQLVARSSTGERGISADAFVAGPRQTALAADEILVEARFPALPPGTGWGFAELARRHGDPALAIAVALLRLGPDGAIGDDVVVTVGAVAGRPQRAEAAEAALRGAKPDEGVLGDAARAAAELAEDDPGPIDPGPTPHPPAVPLTYRRRLAEATVRTALERALASLAPPASSNGGTTA